MEKTGRPSSEQVVEGIGKIGQGILRSIPWALQQCIGDKNLPEKVRWFISCNPIIKEVMSRFQFLDSDVLLYKARLLGVNSRKIPQEIPEDFTGYSFDSIFITDLTKALIEFTPQIPISDFFAKRKAEHCPTVARYTNYPLKNALTEYSGAWKNIVPEDTKSKKILSCEEILDLMLDTTIRAVLKNKDPFKEILQVIQPDHRNKPITIICSNQVIESREESKRPMMIEIDTTKLDWNIDIKPWPTKWAEPNGKNRPSNIENNGNVGFILQQ